MSTPTPDRDPNPVPDQISSAATSGNLPSGAPMQSDPWAPGPPVPGAPDAHLAGPHAYAAPFPAGPVPAAAPPKKRYTLPLIVAGLAALLVAALIGAAIGSRFGAGTPVAAGTSSAGSAAPSAGPQNAAAVAAAAAAAATSSARAAAERARLQDRTQYSPLTDREWKLIAKNPTAYIGKTYIVYGAVTQFDSATGTDAMRANVEATRQSARYDYDQNTYVNEGVASVLKSVVEDDILRMYVRIDGAKTYETTMRGSITVPEVTAFIVEPLS